MARLRKVLPVVVSVWFLGSGVLCLAQPRLEVKLVLRPQKVPAELGKFSLLPPEESLNDGDAVPLYEKAAKALPDKAGDKQILKWLEMPIDQLPVEQVEQTLGQYMESLKYVARAVKCRQCNWPQGQPGKEIADQQGFRRLASVIRLWARLEIASGGYDGAVLALQTGLGMGKHLGQAPTIMEILTAVGVGGAMCIEVEEFVQRKDSPNLYLALAGPAKTICEYREGYRERNESGVGAVERQSIRQADGEPVENGLRSSTAECEENRCPSGGFEYVEAIRLYAAIHGGQLPGTLTEITENPAPKDPISGGLFQYTRTGSTAVLESAIPPGGNERHKVHYEISVRN